jgi:type IV pilus assembly protein PilA
MAAKSIPLIGALLTSLNIRRLDHGIRSGRFFWDHAIMSLLTSAKSTGFTLIELMITVAIVGILAAVAMPAYRDYIIRSQVSEALILMGHAKNSVYLYWYENGAMPDSNADAAIGDPTSIEGTYVSQVAIAGSGVITATFGNNAHLAILNEQCSLTPRLTGGSVTWTGSCTFPNQWRPKSFRD